MSTGGDDDLVAMADVGKARQLAATGIDQANHGNYSNAIRLFTEAIKLQDDDYRFFVNRAFCFQSVRLYDEALEDANRAIALAPKHQKGHYRKAIALLALHRFNEASDEFTEVLRLDPDCELSKKKLFEIQYIMLREQGKPGEEAEREARDIVQKSIHQQQIKRFEEELEEGFEESIRVAEPALDKSNDPFTSSPDNLLNVPKEIVEPKEPLAENQKVDKVFVETPKFDPETGQVDFNQEQNPVIVALSHASSIVRLEPATNLYIFHGVMIYANLQLNCGIEKLKEIFSAFGCIVNVRIKQVGKKLCFIIDYDNPASPLNAVEQIRSSLIRDTKVCVDVNRPLTLCLCPSVDQEDNPITPKKAVLICANNGECFHWRGPIGCDFRSVCNYKHIRANNAIDSHLIFEKSK